jgi:hypothetical protein
LKKDVIPRVAHGEYSCNDKALGRGDRKTD